jgi:hypothetical protein
VDASSSSSVYPMLTPCDAENRLQMKGGGRSVRLIGRRPFGDGTLQAHPDPWPSAAPPRVNPPLTFRDPHWGGATALIPQGDRRAVPRITATVPSMKAF